MPLPMLQKKTSHPFDAIRHVIAVAAGKGGVGKSTTTAQLALALRQLGHSVGLIDGDIYGPTSGTLWKAASPPKKAMQTLIPATSAHGIHFLSIAQFCTEEASLAYRAPLANRFVQQFILNARFGPLDFLLIDFPPGTGDVPLSLLQYGKIDAALLVTTPQRISLQDVRRAFALFRQQKVPILGIVENMSYYEGPNGERTHPFGQGKTKEFAHENHLPFLGEIPLDPSIAQAMEEGMEKLTVQKDFFAVALSSLAALAKKGQGM